MKTNAYTTMIKELHAPAPAVERALAYAHSRSAAPVVRYRRPLFAAVIVLLVIGVGVIYGIFLAPSGKIYLDSRESVTITLNSRGKVLSADGYAGLSGRSAEDAVGFIVRDMMNSGAIDTDENTLILGSDRLSEKAQANLLDTVLDVYTESRFHGAIISLSCSDTGAKAAVIDLLVKADNNLDANSLKHLSVNDLNLLLHEYVTDGAELIGMPSESGYIGKEAALLRARENSKLADAEFTVNYTVYHDRLVYLVRIIGKDQAEAFFIKASDGGIETALRTTPVQLEREIRTEVKTSELPAETPTIRPADADILPGTEPVTETSSTAIIATQPATALNTTAPATIATVQTAGSAEEIVPVLSDRTADILGKASLITSFSDSEIITDSRSYGDYIPFEQVSFNDRVFRIGDGSGYVTSEQANRMIRQDNCLAVVNSDTDYLYLEARAFDEENTELLDYLEGTTDYIYPYSSYYNDDALIIAACCFTENSVAVSPRIASVQRSGNTLYVTIQCSESTKEYDHTNGPRLHKCFVSAKVSKGDIQNIGTLKLVLAKE